MKLNFFILVILLPVFLSGCYSFRGISIPPEVSTYYVESFDNRAFNAPPTLPQTFSESLKDKIRNESRLSYTDVDPDITFSGAITDFRVTSEAPTEGETTAFNRLEIRISIEYSDSQDEKNDWKQTFSFFDNFPSDQDLIAVQDDLIEAINEQIIEDVFNKAFNNW